jgi:hypothetical protein
MVDGEQGLLQFHFAASNWVQVRHGGNAAAIVAAVTTADFPVIGPCGSKNIMIETSRK